MYRNCDISYSISLIIFAYLPYYGNMLSVNYNLEEMIMKKITVSLLLALSLLLCAGCQSSKEKDVPAAADVQKHPEVEAVLNNYMDGTFNGDVELLKSVFHPDAIMTGYMGDQLMIGDPNPFFEDIGSNPSMSSQGMKYEGKITKLLVNGNIADAVIYETGFYGEGTLENHFHLLKDANGEWKIISKCFTTVN